MRWFGRSALVIGAALLRACDASEPFACTTEFRFGISVEVSDAVTGAGIADGATMVLRDGDYVETVTDTFDGLRMVGAGERAGTYSIDISRDGYQSWATPSVRVFEDECHVQTASMQAQLQPIG